MVPVLESHEVTVALKYGVALSGLPMIEMIAATGVNEGLLDGGVPFRYPDHERPSVETLSTGARLSRHESHAWLISRTLLTYGDGRAHVERTSGPPKVIDPGVYVLFGPAVSAPVACAQIRSSWVATTTRRKRGPRPTGQVMPSQR